MASNNTSSCPDPGSDLTKGEAAEIAKAVAYLCIFILSTVGNFLVVVLILGDCRLRSVAINQFIVSMAMADLLTSFFNMTIEIWIHIKCSTGQQVFWLDGAGGVILCKTVVFVQGLSIACSVLTLVAMAVNRYFAVFFPLKMGTTKSLSTLTIVIIWLVSTVTASPMLYAMRVIEKPDGTLHCIEDWTPAFDSKKSHRNYTIFLLTILYAIPLVAVTMLYTAVVRKVWKRQVPGNITAPNQSVELVTKKRVLRMLITIVIVFGLCWLPYYTYLALLSIIHGCPPEYVSFLGLFLGHANSAINPCIYAIFNKECRASLRGAKGACFPTMHGSRVPIIATNQNTVRQTDLGFEETSRGQERRTLLIREIKEMKEITQSPLRMSPFNSLRHSQVQFTCSQ